MIRKSPASRLLITAPSVRARVRPIIAAQTHAPVNHARFRIPTSYSVMPRPLVMLAPQISAVVVAVGRARDYVNVIFVMLFVLGKGLAGLMIELDQQHRAMDAVIENAVFFHAADLAYGSNRSVRRRVRRKI
jgi:hypothetical protein